MKAAVSPAAAATERVWQLVTAGTRTVVVDGPPGGGKSTLVQTLARRLGQGGEQVPVVAQSDHHADALAYGLAAQLAGTDTVVGRLHAGHWRPGSPPLPASLLTSARVDDLDRCAVVVATAGKWAYVPDRTWPLGIVDEAYQMSAAALVRVGALFDRLVLVGDPGQLGPCAATDEPAVRRLATWPLDTATGAVLRHHPDTPVVSLPVSWRLPPPAAEVVSAAFYCRRFDSAVGAGVRRLWFEASPSPDPIGQVLTVAAGSGWGMLELPAAYLPQADPEAVNAVVAVVTRLLSASPVLADETGSRPLSAAEVAIGVTHHDQRARMRAAADEAGLAQVTVETAAGLQGRQFAVTVVWHPLSGRRDASAFPLESGRLCVLASRHRHACIVVTRAGIRAQLANTPVAEPVWFGPGPAQVDGWEAHQEFLDKLAPHTVAG